MSTPSHYEKAETKFNLLPYASNVGSPVIVVEDTDHFKRKQVTKFNNFVDKRFSELKSEMEKLVDAYKLNEFIFSIGLKFEPIVGETYYVYQNEKTINFLSMIAPHECKFLYICSVKLNTEGQWVLIDGTFQKS
jgi:hypothetical protein